MEEGQGIRRSYCLRGEVGLVETSGEIGRGAKDGRLGRIDG